MLLFEIYNLVNGESVMIKCEIIKLDKQEYNWYKIYYISNDKIELQHSDRIQIIYSDKERYTATVIEINEDESGKFITLSPWSRGYLHTGECQFELTFSPRKSIKGADEIIRAYEYWPSFHDDEIEELKMDSSGICMTISMNITPDDKKECKVILKLHQIEQMELKDWWRCNIIFSIDFKYNGDFIEVGIDASLGVVGSILCKEVSVELV